LKRGGLKGCVKPGLGVDPSYLFMPDNTTQKPAGGQRKIDFEAQMTGLGPTFPSHASAVMPADLRDEKAMIVSNGSKCDMVGRVDSMLQKQAIGLIGSNLGGPGAVFRQRLDEPKIQLPKRSGHAA
jgi:hypothetical protein